MSWALVPTLEGAEGKHCLVESRKEGMKAVDVYASRYIILQYFRIGLVSTR